MYKRKNIASGYDLPVKKAKAKKVAKKTAKKAAPKKVAKAIDSLTKKVKSKPTTTAEKKDAIPTVLFSLEGNVNKKGEIIFHLLNTKAPQGTDKLMLLRRAFQASMEVYLIEQVVRNKELTKASFPEKTKSKNASKKSKTKK